MRVFGSRSAFAVTVCVAVAATAGTAYGYWSASGSGNGTAVTRNGLAPISATATVTSGTAFYPGAAAATLNVTVDNTANSYPLTVTSVTRDSSRQITVAHPAGTCSAYAITVSTPQDWAGFTVAAAASTTGTIPAAVSMTSADSGCQGATFTIPVTLAGRN